VADGFLDGVLGLIMVLGPELFNLLSPLGERTYSGKEYYQILEDAGFLDVYQEKKRLLNITMGTSP
jgi:hypothetical protein